MLQRQRGSGRTRLSLIYLSLWECTQRSRRIALYRLSKWVSSCSLYPSICQRLKQSNKARMLVCCACLHHTLTFRPAASLIVKVEDDLVILRSMVMMLPNTVGLNASCPVFHKETAATACEQPVLMNCSTLEARPVARAFTPKQHCMACRLALLPLPLLPEMKFTCGLQMSRPETQSQMCW